MTGTDRLPASAEWRKHWTLVAAATAGMSLSALSTSTFGVMLAPIENDLGWSRTEIAFGPMLISLIMVCFATLYGVAIDRFGPRRLAIAGVIILSGALASFSQVSGDVWQWWALWGIAGLAAAMMPAVWVAPINITFNAGRGLAMAIVLSGSGISSSLAPVAANAFVESYGWRLAYLYLVGIWFAVVFTLVILFLRTPRRQAPPASDTHAQPDAAIALPGLTAKEGFRSFSFYKLLAATVLANFAGIAMVLNLVPMLQGTGLVPATAAGVASFIGVSTIAGRIAGGAFMDRFKASNIAATAAALMAILPLSLLLFPGNVPLSIAAVVISGMMGGAIMPCISYLASRYFGQRAFGTLYATIIAVMAIGIGLGPVLANVVYDAVQSYNPVLLGVLPLFAAGALLFASLGPYPDFSGTGKPGRTE